MDNDWLLIHRMKQGDDDAFDSFVRKYYGDMLRYCTFHSASHEDAEDLTQETFVRFFAHLSDYRHTGKAKNYLYTIAANLCCNAWAKRAPTLTDEGTLAELAVTTDSEAAQTTHLLLEQALNALAPELREVIILHYYQDLKQREIAEILSIGLPLVKYRLRQAKAQLETLIGEEDHS